MSLRCSDCDANWQETSANAECPSCGVPTWQTNEKVDKTWEEAKHARERRAAWATTDTVEIPALPKDYLYAHRVERFGALGFDDVQAELLASAKDALGFPLYWGDIQRALQAGATLAAAVAIYA